MATDLLLQQLSDRLKAAHKAVLEGDQTIAASELVNAYSEVFDEHRKRGARDLSIKRCRDAVLQVAWSYLDGTDSRADCRHALAYPEKAGGSAGAKALRAVFDHRAGKKRVARGD